MLHVYPNANCRSSSPEEAWIMDHDRRTVPGRSITRGLKSTPHRPAWPKSDISGLPSCVPRAINETLTIIHRLDRLPGPVHVPWPSLAGQDRRLLPSRALPQPGLPRHRPLFDGFARSGPVSGFRDVPHAPGWPQRHEDRRLPEVTSRVSHPGSESSSLCLGWRTPSRA